MPSLLADAKVEDKDEKTQDDCVRHSAHICS